MGPPRSAGFGGAQRQAAQQLGLGVGRLVLRSAGQRGGEPLPARSAERAHSADGRRGGGGGRRYVNKGSNLRIKVKLTLSEIANGVEKKIKVNKKVACGSCTGTGALNGSSFNKCGTCGGSGQVRRVTNTILGQMQTASTCPSCQGEGQTITNKCKSCNGFGTMPGEEVISINIPPGVGEGMQVSVSGKGNAAERGGVVAVHSTRLAPGRPVTRAIGITATRTCRCRHWASANRGPLQNGRVHSQRPPVPRSCWCPLTCGHGRPRRR